MNKKNLLPSATSQKAMKAKVFLELDSASSNLSLSELVEIVNMWQDVLANEETFTGYASPVLKIHRRMPCK